MTRHYLSLLRGRKNLATGFVALLIISMIVLGCTCNDKEGFNFGSSNSNSTETTEKQGEDTDTSDADDKNGSFKADEDEVPADSQVQKLVKNTLLKFNEAVADKDFGAFRDSVSKRWRDSSKTSDFEKGFKEFIEKKIDISRIEGEEADFSPKPYIDKKYGKQVLFIKGDYDTEPLPVNFNLEYIVENEEWKLVFIGIDTRKK